ncbi:MAG: CARDB domain-containing protein [Bacteroidales bacterium]|nr:CARDB domain-containing protein [Bacteroidales bacterium]
MKRLCTTYWLSLLMVCSLPEVQAQEVIFGYSGLFTLNTTGVQTIVGYSDIFTLNTTGVQTIVGYSDIFTLNTTLGQIMVGYSPVFSFNTIGAQVGANFIASDTVAMVNQQILFTDQSSGVLNPNSWTWNFGAGANPATATTKGPHNVSYSSVGSKTVTLTVKNAAGASHTEPKADYIRVNSQNNGIFLKIIKTDPGSAPVITKVGYHYKTETNKQIRTHLVTFDIVNGEVLIDNFPAPVNFPSGTKLKRSFDNEIILFGQAMVPRGHIHYEYDPAEEREHKRSAILMLHNDSEIRQDGAFPYSTSSPEYDAHWRYYKISEYPVSMLIPPNNNFPMNDDKIPLLLIHGWEGKYEVKKNPDAEAKLNETSYWFTTVKRLNLPGSEFAAWQYYYPYNSAHKHLAICLKSALEHLKTKYTSQKIRLVTHSMGGLVTLRYLTHFPIDAKSKVKKVLFMAPPAHGSLGANLYYKTIGGAILQASIGYDRHAPSVRDMKLGSDATWDIQDPAKPLPDLNSQNGLGDDYFVMLGTTYNFFRTDTYRKFNTPFHSCLHPEAANHHDGIVSISSGSLLDKGVGFATFHGNHDDAVHMQSYKRGSPNNQNIGSVDLLPSIIEQYFTLDYFPFLNKIKDNNHITAIVKPDRTVLKPSGQNLGNLNTNNWVDYKKGLLNIEFDNQVSPSTYQALYDSDNRVLSLWPKYFDPGNILFKGVFKCNTNSKNGKRYYFNDDQTIFKKEPNVNRAVIYNGCGIKLVQGENRIFVYDMNDKRIAVQPVHFKYCETNNVKIHIPNKLARNSEDNYTDTKKKYIVIEGTTVPDTLLTSFFVDDQATMVDFNISPVDVSNIDYPIRIKLKLPDGSPTDSTFPGSTYFHDYSLRLISLKIPNPMPGRWYVWLESSHPGANTMLYSAVAFLRSSVHSFLPDSTEVIAANAPMVLRAGLKVNDFNLTSGLRVIATVNKPNGGKDIFNITSSAVTQGSSYLFTLNYNFDLQGEYLVKYNIDGVYNTFNFERCLHQYIEAVDTIPFMFMPDISLRQQEPHKVLDLSQYIYNIDDYDTLFFSSEVISSNLSSLAFSASFDSLALYSYLHSNLSDTGTVVVRYTCHFDNLTVSDTMMVRVLLPELYVENVAISDSIIGNESDLLINYTLRNTGNFHAGAYDVSYYISNDSIIDQTDFCLKSKPILFHAADSILMVSDTLQLPVLNLFGSSYFLVKADAGNEINEIDELNNQVTKNLVLNLPPDPPIIISANPGNESVRLKWTSNYQPDIAGYIIYYGTDTTAMLNKIYRLNRDTVHTVSGLINDMTYYFALTGYKIMLVESELSNFVSATPGTCVSLSPVGLNTNNLTTISANLTWTSTSNETQWDIKWGLAGFNPASQGTLIGGVTANPYTHIGLTAATAYDFYVRAVCGEQVSAWAGPASFTTLPGILLGDANCNGTVNVLDIITMINYIMDLNPAPFCFQNADVNGDANVNVLDVIGVINIIMGGK